MFVEDGEDSNEDSTTNDEEQSEGTDNTPSSDELTPEQIEKALSSETGRRLLQSEADKRQAAYERRARTERAAEVEKLRKQREDQELLDLAEREDYAGLGERTAQSLQKQRQLAEAAQQVTGAIEGVVKEHPEFRTIGEERMTELYEAVASRGGSVVDFMVDLAKEKESQGVKSALAEAKQEFSTELEAKLAEFGLSKRTEEGGPDAEVSGGGTPAGNLSDEDKILERWNSGDPSMDIKEVRPILKKRGIEV
jgi:hypothetical protein